MKGHIIKTIYFPSDRTLRGGSTRVAVSIPAASNGNSFSANFLKYVSTLSSREFRGMLGNPVLEHLEVEAHAQQETLSGYCIKVLWERYAQSVPSASRSSAAQMALPFDSNNLEESGVVGLTFRDSKRTPIHRWYPYVEGFSASYIREQLQATRSRAVFDPFGGVGTTQVEAGRLGIQSFFCEINPFASFVALTKVNATSWACQNRREFGQFAKEFLALLSSKDFGDRVAATSLETYHAAFPARDFFKEVHLRELLSARDLAVELAGTCDPARDLLLLTVAANIVHCSNMTRRADLRRRRPDEYKQRVVNPVASIAARVREMLQDLATVRIPLAPTRQVSADVRSLPTEYYSAFDFAITSPPYLNGTNYFRNTKLELWFLGYIASECDLKTFYRSALASGINNISKDRPEAEAPEEVETVAKTLDQNATDSRIPRLVRAYFADMHAVLEKIKRALKTDGRFVLDIGDSKFYGIHVPTDELLIATGKRVGFEIESVRTLARRYSLDKTPLKQVEIVFRKPRHSKMTAPFHPSLTEDQAGYNSSAAISRAIATFARELPHRIEPFSKRSWGHKLHSVCSYQGKFKPSFAHWLVTMFSRPGMTVLDPLGGVGTIAFEACSTGRFGISNDLNPLASLVASAKLCPPSLSSALASLAKFEDALRDVRLTKGDFEDAEFGLNAKVKDYYHPKTLEEILKARKLFLKRRSLSQSDRFLKACLLHILHGNRPYALSRRSHSLTPFHPTGPADYRPLVEKLGERVSRFASLQLPAEFSPGKSLSTDFRNLREHIAQRVDRIITSPPFIGTRFDRPNWLRLWFLGWGAEDFHATREHFLERQQMVSMNVYEEFFDLCADLLDADGLLILHLGGSSAYDMVGALTKIAEKRFIDLGTVAENVDRIEKHGVNDKGLTSTHHLLFFRKH